MVCGRIFLSILFLLYYPSSEFLCVHFPFVRPSFHWYLFPRPFSFLFPTSLILDDISVLALKTLNPFMRVSISTSSIFRGNLITLESRKTTYMPQRAIFCVSVDVVHAFQIHSSLMLYSTAIYGTVIQNVHTYNRTAKTPRTMMNGSSYSAVLSSPGRLSVKIWAPRDRSSSLLYRVKSNECLNTA